MSSNWWTHDPRERYWLEITDRDDLGANLKAPQTNELGKPYWSYSLISEVRPSDVVLHYRTPERAIVGVSTAEGPLEERDIIWGARGTSARSQVVAPHLRKGWLLPLSGYRAITPSVTLRQITTRREEVLSIRTQLKGAYGPNLYFPFAPYGKDALRAQQGYLTKFPRALLAINPTLSAFADDGAPETTTPLASDLESPEDSTPAERALVSLYRILRDTALARRLKVLHRNECQLCGATITLRDGTRYSEAHHVRPLGLNHGGPDVRSNILVLCPNHHAMCDLGVIPLTRGDIRAHPEHSVGDEFLDYHNSRIFGETAS